MNSDYLAGLRWLEPAPENFRAAMLAAVADSDVAALRGLADRALSEAQLHQLGRAFVKARGEGKIFAGLSVFRLAVLSNATVNHLATPLIATALRYGVDLHILGLSYEEAYAAAVGGDARLGDFAPDAVLVAFDYRALPLQENFGDAAAERQVVADCAAYLRAIYDGIGRLGAVCLAQTIACPPCPNFGNADSKIAGTLRRIIDGVNQWIGETADAVVDVAALAAAVGTAQWFDARAWHNGKLPFALNYVPLYADHIGRVVGALRGKSRRVIVVDLDNTLWGGVVGDDGVNGIVIGNGSPAGEAFLDFQRKLLSLRKRGILLAVSSKNDEGQARRPFRELPDMLLKEESFSAFRANWQDKAANIRAIAEELSLGLDAFVFVDDNPHERALVRRFLPEVAVPEMPDDAADYSFVLDAAGYFEALSFSDEDARRPDLYRERGAVAQVAPNDLAAYLASLEMKLTIEGIHDGNRGRVVQLINKSNQFNLTTLRLSDAEMRGLEGKDGFHGFALRLSDKFTAHGIISIILGRKEGDIFDLFLWVMSCRVIGRGVEKAALGFIAQQAARSLYSDGA